MAEKTPPPKDSPDTFGWPHMHDAHSKRLEDGKTWEGVDSLELDTSFVHVMKSMVLDGYMAKIGPVAFAVFIAIKCHSDFKTGIAFPSRARLSELVGVSIPTIDAALAALTKHKLIRKGKIQGKRSTAYALVEAVPIRKDGEVIAVASKDYSPESFSDVRALKEAIVKMVQNGVMSGEAAKGLVINVNVTHQHFNVVQGDNSTFNAVGNVSNHGAPRPSKKNAGDLNGAW